MDVKSLCTVIHNDCGLQALTYFLDKRDFKEPSTSTLKRLAELVLTLNAFSFNNDFYRQIGGVAMGSKTMPANSLVLMWNCKSAVLRIYPSVIQEIHRRHRWSSIMYKGRRNSKPSLTSFQTSTRHSNLHPPSLKQNYPFWTSTCIFLMIRFKPPSTTRKQILTSTSISLLSILITAYVPSLTASFSACVDSAPTMMTSS